MTDSVPYHIPKQPGKWRAITLALAVHIILLMFLWIGIRWQNTTPLAVEAEIWDPQIREAAPPPTPPVAQPPVPSPTPIPEPTPQPAPKPVAVEEPPVEKPDIALEKEQKKKEQEQQEREQARIKEEQQKKEKQAAEQKLAQQKEEAQAKAKLAADKLVAAKRQQQQTADAKAAEQRRQDDLKRMMSQAGDGSTGTAAKSQGPRGSADYIGKLSAKIKSNTVFIVPEGLAGNPAVEYAVDLLPDGSVRGLRKIKSSGIPGFDEAVARAVEKSQPFPPDKDGKVPASFTFTHRPKDQ